MDLSAEKLRWSSLNVIVKAYKTQVPVSFLSAVLGFEPAAASGSVATGIGGDTLPPQPPPPSQPLPGCRERVYAGKSGASADAASGEAACCEWLTAHGALIAEDDGGVLDVKASTGRLFIPEDPKSSHGDDNLSLGDFLSAAARASQGPVML
ncbi:hypothetical protein FOA52_005208 [Chlamydomonas sp. UWO 241]|nr:hypothetical protein FOA52_005208 [Chlamydomonas sp. UWO 241]